jgi:SHS2 domain-containing protein
MRTFVDHTGEVELRLRAPTFAALLDEAALALAELMLGEDAAPAAPDVHESVVVRARDREALLVAWLDELIFRAETRKAVFTRFDFRRVEDGEIAAEIHGVAEPVLKTAVKAATYHGLRVADEDGGLVACVVLDV